MSVADAFAAIDDGLSALGAVYDRCVTRQEYDQVDAEYEALKDVKTFITRVLDALRTTDQMFRAITAYDEDVYGVYPFLAVNDELLTVNRPAVDGGDGVGVRWLDSDTVGEGER